MNPSSKTAAATPQMANPLLKHPVSDWEALVFPGSSAPHTHQSPLDHSDIATLPTCTTDDVAKAFDLARKAQESWATTPYSQKKSIMMAFHDLVLDEQESLLDAVQWESGKSRSSAFDEVADIALTARYYANSAKKHLAPSKDRWSCCVRAASCRT